MTTIICHRTFLLKRHFQEVFVCRSSRAQHFSTSDVTIRYSAILFAVFSTTLWFLPKETSNVLWISIKSDKRRFWKQGACCTFHRRWSICCNLSPRHFGFNQFPQAKPHLVSEDGAEPEQRKPHGQTRRNIAREF